MHTSLSLFHPAIQSWFQANFGEATPIQEAAWPEIKNGRHTLIAAPTGSGKTLAAFLAAIDSLVREDEAGTLIPGIRVVYVSPLRALSNDIEKNLQIPLRGINDELIKERLAPLKIKISVRTGDTPQSERTQMIKNPPHILVTTPESLFLLLTSASGRAMLSSTETLILDEIHALIGDKRGSHLSLSIERLQSLTIKPLQRIGLSATQKPVEQVARYLTGNGNSNIPPDCAILDTGHRKTLDIAVEVPESSLTAVMSNEVWDEIFSRLEILIREHKTTLIFVNTRRLAERLAHTLSALLGAEAVSAHHGSLSKEHRFDAEQRLKGGSLRVLVATASLELGIDIGSVDLVIQIGSTRSIAAFLQRVGRSRHQVGGIPKGRVFPLTRDELIECASIMDAINHGELDRIIMPEKPLDIIAQQIIAEVSCGEKKEDELFDIFSKAYPYRDFSKQEFQEILTMLADGFTLRRGRSGAYLHYDRVNGMLRARKGAKLSVIMNGGAIPDTFDYDVVLDPAGIVVGTLNEDFAIETTAGAIFQLGNTSWQVLKVETGKVRVMDAKGQPPTIPFWLGEAPGRTDELSHAVSRFRDEVITRLGDLENKMQRLNDLQIPVAEAEAKPIAEQFVREWAADALEWMENELHIPASGAEQIVLYLASGKLALGVMPSKENLMLERFFDDAGDMHLVIHSPFGSRINKAWGLSLRKKFCRNFNFELQAAANENAIILSLGSTHSFTLPEVYKYLKADHVKEVLVQALLDQPMFGTRFRWNASRALAVLRRRGDRKVPPQIQRMQSEDLIALVFPDQLACFENIQGERQVPDHPLVNQTLQDCLHEVMDLTGLEQLLTNIENGNIGLHAMELTEPSPFAAEILNARPYAFLDDAPLEERRTRAVSGRRWLDPAEAANLGRLDEKAIEQVKEEVWPQGGSPDELHDALMLLGMISKGEGQYGNGFKSWEEDFEILVCSGRACRFILNQKEKECGERVQNDSSILQTVSAPSEYWIAAEKLPMIRKIWPDGKYVPELELPDSIRNEEWEETNAWKELLRGRMEASGPVTEKYLANVIPLSASNLQFAIASLENEGFLFRGKYTPGITETEFVERRLLARIHRYTLGKLRKEIEPVSLSDFMRFLFKWQKIELESRGEGPEALQNILEMLEGYEAPAGAWEADILPQRMKEYDPVWLDVLCLSGRITWGRFRDNTEIEKEIRRPGPIRSSPVTIVRRDKLNYWLKHRNLDEIEKSLQADAITIFQYIKIHGASFFEDMVKKTGLLRSQVENALGELTGKGLVTSDSFTGLRALITPSDMKPDKRNSRGKAVFGMEFAGRWTILQNHEATEESKEAKEEESARIMLRRYGVIFRRIADTEAHLPPWRDMVRILRRLEMRGEVRGGRFVDGVSGEQFALPEAAGLLRNIRKEKSEYSLVAISAADPLNLTGTVLPGSKVTGYQGNRILFRNGEAVASFESNEIKFFIEPTLLEQREWNLFLRQRILSPRLRQYLGKNRK